MASNRSHSDRSYLPSCWNDDLRMQALFSVFRKKELNPTGWQEKMDFWTLAISDYCKTMKQAVISAEHIRIAFVKENRYPNCIDDVLDHMLQQRLLADAEDFGNLPSNSWIGWGYSGVKKSVSWGWGLALSLLREQTEQPRKTGKFVVISVVKEMADRIMERHAELVEMEKADYVIEPCELQSHCKDICTGDSFHYALVSLEREKKILRFTENERQFLKFPKEDENSKSISEADKAIVKLKQTIATVTKQVDTLDKEVDLCTKDARQLVQAGNKAKAMCVLKKRKRLESELKRKAASLDNLESLLIQLQHCDSGKHVLDAYNIGVNAMKGCLSRDLDANKVDTTMSDIQEISDEIADIEFMMSRGVVSGAGDEDDLEEELDAILSSQNEEEILTNKETDEEELLRRLNALKQPSSSPISPVSESRSRRGMAQQKYDPLLQ